MELFLRRSGEVLTTRPIKGTVGKGFESRVRYYKKAKLVEQRKGEGGKPDDCGSHEKRPLQGLQGGLGEGHQAL